MQFSAVLLAAGKSSRFCSDPQYAHLKKKVFVEWDEKPLFAHSLERLSSVFEFNEVALVISLEDEAYFIEAIKRLDWNHRFNLKLVFGGDRRQDSVRNGLQQISMCDRVLIHDAARPFCRPEFLNRLKESSAKYQALIPVVPISETVKRVDQEGLVVESLDRASLFRVQTPQVFDYEIITGAHADFADSSKEFTDDSMMLEDLGYAVQTVEGCLENIKVTHPQDLIQKGII